MGRRIRLRGYHAKVRARQRSAPRHGLAQLRLPRDEGLRQPPKILNGEAAIPKIEESRQEHVPRKPAKWLQPKLGRSAWWPGM